MPSSLPLNDAGFGATSGKRGPSILIGSNGRMSVLNGTGNALRIYTALTTDSAFSLTASYTAPNDTFGEAHGIRIQSQGDDLHVVSSTWHDTYVQPSSNGGSWDWALFDLTTGVATGDGHTFVTPNSGYRMHSVEPVIMSDGVVAISYHALDTYRSMGSNYDAGMVCWAASPSWSWSSDTVYHATVSRYVCAAYPTDGGDVIYHDSYSAASKLELGGTFTADLANESGISRQIAIGSQGTNAGDGICRHSNVGNIFYNTTDNDSYHLGYQVTGTGSGVLSERRMHVPSATSHTLYSYELPSEFVWGEPIGYYYDEAAEISYAVYQDGGALFMSKRTDFTSGWSDPVLVYSHSGPATFTNGKPVGLYKSGGTVYAIAVFGDTGDADVVWDIPLVAVGEINVDVSLSRSLTKSIGGVIDLGGYTLATVLARSYSKSVSSSLFAPALGLTQGWESRYQTAEAGQLLERNIYRAYVGATEFPLYSISASFGGLSATTGDASGSAQITLKAPLSSRDWLVSQIGQEFIVLNGVELAGVFQGVEFVRGNIDEVVSAGDFAIVSTTRSEDFPVGVELTIRRGVEYISRQRVRIGQINPTLRPGARVFTERGTFDISQLTIFVGLNQKFMEFAAYG